MNKNVLEQSPIESKEKEPISRRQSKRRQTTIIVGTAIFAAISVLLYIAKVPPFIFPIFPPPFDFLEINFSEVPAMIAGFAYGPLSGFMVLVIRFLVKLPLTSTAMIGEVADIIYSSSFVLTATIIYKYRRTFKGVLLGLSIAFFVQVIVSAAANYFVIYDMYNVLFGGHLPFNAKQFIVYVIPFNMIKNLIIATLTLLVYKRISKFIRGFY
ncbi:MAG: ECF transporter S component [Bacilli bacterium]